MPVLDFLANNPYLAGEVLFLPTLVVLWLLAGPQRGMMLLAGAMAVALSAPLGSPLADAVWSPQHLIGRQLGIEDVLYSFAFGAASWGLATILFRNDYVAHGTLVSFLRRSVLVTLAGLSIFGALLPGVGGAGATVLGIAAIAGWLLLRHPDWRRLACCGGLGFGLLFYFELRVWFAFWPEARNWWIPGTLWDTDLFGVPLGEVAWASLNGAAHPTVMAFICDVRRVTDR